MSAGAGPNQINPIPICNVPGVSEACPDLDPGEWLSDAAGNAAGSAFERAAQLLAEAAEDLMVAVTSAWTRVPSTNPTYRLVGDELITDLRWITGVIAALCLIVGAARYAWTQRADDANNLVAAIARQLFVGSAGLTIVYAALRMGDNFSAWFIEESTGGSFQAETLLTGAAGWALAPGIVFILGLVAVIVGIIEIALLILRNGLVVLLGGFWPIAAAASTTPQGLSMFQRTTGWLVAFILYKPAAAICYGTAYRLLLNDEAHGGDAVLSTVTGVVMLVAAILVLPALIRLCVPAAGVIGGVSGGQVLATGAAVATGAVAIAATGGAAAPAAAGGAAGGAGGGMASGAAGELSSGGGSGGQLPPGSGGQLPGGSGPQDSGPGGGGAGQPGGSTGGGSPADSGSGGTGGAQPQLASAGSGTAPGAGPSTGSAQAAGQAAGAAMSMGGALGRTAEGALENRDDSNN